MRNLSREVTFIPLRTISTMTNGQKASACILGSLALCAAANAVVVAPSGSPYQGIVTRNVFALQPPPKQGPPEPPKPKPSKITLTGIMTIFGKNQALMKAPPLPPAKPGDQPKEQSYILAEGQRDGEIEVVHIDAERGTVKIINAGTVETLTFEENGIQLASAAPAGPVRPLLPLANTAPPPRLGARPL